jgi:hypothetical protein
VVEHSLSLVSTLADSYEIRDVWAAYRAERNR